MKILYILIINLFFTKALLVQASEQSIVKDFFTKVEKEGRIIRAQNHISYLLVKYENIEVDKDPFQRVKLGLFSIDNNKEYYEIFDMHYHKCNFKYKNGIKDSIKRVSFDLEGIPFEVEKTVMKALEKYNNGICQSDFKYSEKFKDIRKPSSSDIKNVIEFIKNW